MAIRWSVVASTVAAIVACGGGDPADAAEGTDTPEVTEAIPEVPETPVAESPIAETPVAAAPQLPEVPDGPGTAPDAQPPTEQPEWHSCARLPSQPSGAAVRSVRDFGAQADDGRDDADAIQRALDTLKAGETLRFPPGRYEIGRSVRVRRPGLTLLGDGATIHATNADDMAIQIEADNTTVASLSFTAVTSGRRSAPRHARIAVYAPETGGLRIVRNTVIRNNRIVAAGDPGTSLANSSSATGIMIQHADGFLIAENLVERTLADGIHMTAGSRNGRVLNNTVRETGDDMIAVVSYAMGGNAALNSAAELKRTWDARVERSLTRNILIANNRGSGQYSGRGISVIGGDNVTIARNTLTNVPVAAAFIFAREANYQTFGVHNVLLEGNVVREVQTQAPPYNPFNKYTPGARTGHGAIEIHAGQFDDEASDSFLRTALAVRNVVARDNLVERTAVNALRAGVNVGKTMTAVNADGQTVSRTVRGALVDGIWSLNNKFNQIAKDPISVPSTTLSASGIACGGTTRDGAPYSMPACRIGGTPPVTGAKLSCSSDGRLL